VTGTTTPSPGILRRLWNRLPASVDRTVRVAAWLTLVTQVLIVGTGGAVRLTGSGLGCPTWPLCTDASLVATPEMGIHGGIEFGNRLLSIVVGIVAVALVIVLMRLRSRRDLFGPAVAILALTVLQGFVGGISVRVALDPAVVGLHFVTSVVLVALSTVVVFRAHRGGRGELTVPGWYAGIVHATSAAVAVTVVAGVLTTGSGPHAGDSAAARNGLDPALLQHVHSWPAYLTLALTLVLVGVAVARRLASVRTWVIALLVVEFVQIVVGLTQSRTGLPSLLVGIHMVLACVLVAVMTATVLSLRARTAEADAAAGRARPRGTPASGT
jgi:cytochrome c oxidase assembly protein subunit 15